MHANLEPIWPIHVMSRLNGSSHSSLPLFWLIHRPIKGSKQCFERAGLLKANRSPNGPTLWTFGHHRPIIPSLRNAQRTGTGQHKHRQRRTWRLCAGRNLCNYSFMGYRPTFPVSWAAFGNSQSTPYFVGCLNRRGPLLERDPGRPPETPSVPLSYKYIMVSPP